MSEHTPEPVFNEPLILKHGYEQSNPGRYLVDATGHIVFAEGCHEEDAIGWELFTDDQLRRIVACVNACRGFDTYTLETFFAHPNEIKGPYDFAVGEFEKAQELARIADGRRLEMAEKYVHVLRERDEARAMVKELAVASWFMQTRLEEWVGGIESEQDEIVIKPVTEAILRAKALLGMTIDDMLQAAYRG